MPSGGWAIFVVALRRAVVVGALGTAAYFAGSSPANSASTFTVNDPGNAFDATPEGICDADEGAPGIQCTLREAIVEADRLSDRDTIDFAIGSGPVTISPQVELPTIHFPLVIDGTSQPGFAGVPLVELSGGAASARASTSAFGLWVKADNCEIRGLVINRWAEPRNRRPAS